MLSSRRWLLVCLCAALSGSVLAAQDPTVSLRVVVHSGDKPLPEAEVSVGRRMARTGADGIAVLTVAPGRWEIAVEKPGFLATTVAVEFAAGTAPAVEVDLQPVPVIDEEVTVVAATRTDKRLEDVPMRVEVLGREEIEEKMLMTPGDIVMMLNEMGGMRVQATSPALGAASVRIQGMRGRYTRVLSDGLPLHGDVGGLGLLQIPPMDLERVEVIKGVASALYGAGAMGGVVNLLSRRPEEEWTRELLLNGSTRGATDLVTFSAGPLGTAWSGSLLAGVHRHGMSDVDDDGWADLPEYERLVARPRLFWTGERGRSVFLTGGLSLENRVGGTIDARAHAAIGERYREAIDTARYDAGVAGQTIWRDRHVITARGSFVRQDHDHAYGDRLERDRHDTAFGEVAIRSGTARHTWVAGAALERDVYTPRDVTSFAYAFTVPGVFAAYDLALSEAWALSASGRLDVHSDYGTFFSPRLSLLGRFAGWTARASAGSGFSAATPVTEETEAAGLSRLRLDAPLEAERGLSGSFDVSRTDGPLTYAATLFASRIRDPLYVERAGEYSIRNLDEPTRNLGVEFLASVRAAPWALTGTYTYVRARETVNGAERAAPLTPAHSAGLVGMWEDEGHGRIGVEWYYTGRQALDENPFRATSAPYSVFGVLVERRIGPVRLFVNGENLTGTRQTSWDPLVRPTRGADLRWTVDAWAPLEGRNVNGGIRVEF